MNHYFTLSYLVNGCWQYHGTLIHGRQRLSTLVAKAALIKGLSHLVVDEVDKHGELFE